MGKSYRQLLIDAEVHERLLVWRAGLSDLAASTPGQFGLSSVIAVLLEHAKQVPPEMGWLQEQLAKLPKKGRPRRSDSDHKPVWGKSSGGGHTYVVCKARPEVSVCVHCTDFRGPEDPDGFGVPCVTRAAQTGQWKKSQLLAMGFTEEEVGWADG